MNIKAQIDRMNAENSKVKAYASVSLDDAFVVRGIRIMEGKNGLFAAMPAESYKNKQGENKYSDTFYALTVEGRQQLSDTVLSAYERCLHMEENKLQEPDEPEKSPAFEQRM